MRYSHSTDERLVGFLVWLVVDQRRGAMKYSGNPKQADEIFTFDTRLFWLFEGLIVAAVVVFLIWFGQ